MAASRFDSATMTTLLEAVGEPLAAAGAELSIVVVGGAALALRGWVPRTTQDVDVIALASPTDALAPPDFPTVLERAIERVARDFDLPANWLNAAVGAQWRAGLPTDLAHELEWRRFGALRVGLAGRNTLIALKLFAAADRGPTSVHAQDLIALAPSDDEFASARIWVLTQDLAPEWPRLVSEVVNHVRARRLR